MVSSVAGFVGVCFFVFLSSSLEGEGEKEKERKPEVEVFFFLAFLIIKISQKKKKKKKRYDANISLPGCDKNMPGTIIAAARLDRPSLMIYGGTIKPGASKGGEPLDIVSAFQSYGEFFFSSFFSPFSFLLYFSSSSSHEKNTTAPSLVKQSAFAGFFNRGTPFLFCSRGGGSDAYAH